MAHGEEKIRAVRGAFVFEQLGLEVAANKHGVPEATARRWKRDAKAEGDDWDKARSAQMIAGGGMEDVVRQTLALAVRQVQATLELLQTNPGMPPAEQVKALASLSDSYNKLMAVSKRLMPETDKLAVAMDVIKRLDAFVRESYPQHAGAFAELLAPFGQDLAKAYN